MSQDFPSQGATQKFLVERDGWGDCWKCCILHFLPSHVKYEDLPSLWANSAYQQLKDTEYVLYRYEKKLVSFYRISDAIAEAEDGERVIVCGVSPRATNRGHAIIGVINKKKGSVDNLWDPHPDRSFIKGSPFEVVRVVNIPRE